jgi:hypothetical protein
MLVVASAGSSPATEAVRTWSTAGVPTMTGSATVMTPPDTFSLGLLVIVTGSYPVLVRVSA